MYITEASIEDSFTFSLFNVNKNITKNMVSFIKTGVLLDKSYIEEQYIQIKKTRLSPLVDKVLDAFDNGEIELIYSKHAKVSISFPFVVRKSEGKIVSTIFISNFSTLSKDSNSININMKDLYVLLESAYVARFMNVHANLIQRNTGLMKICNSVYTAMFMRILNREYALSLDKALYDNVSFVISRFFLEKVWGTTNTDVIYNYASSTSTAPNHMELDIVNEAYSNAGIKDISDALLFLKTLSPRLESISVRYMVERYMNTYHGGSILAMDNLPYLFLVIINIMMGAFLVSQTALSEIIKSTKGMNAFYSELGKVLN